MKANPFRVGEIVAGSAAYCARPETEEKLARLLKDTRRVLLQDERRVGKSSVVLETARKYFGGRIIRIDMARCQDNDSIAAAFFTGWARYQNTQGGSLERHLKALPFEFTVDLKILQIRPRQLKPDQMLAHFFTLVRGAKRPPLIFFDEFQALSRLEKSERESFLWGLRDELQSSGDLCVIFAGSDRNTLRSIFLGPQSPFLNTVYPFDLDPIPEERLREWASELFRTGGFVLTDGAWEAIKVTSRMIPGYLQELCRAIWTETGPGEIGVKDVERGVDVILKLFTGIQDFALPNYTPNQLRLAIAIARFEPEQITSSKFLSEAGIAGSASALRALKALERGNLVEQREGCWRFYNPFVREWFLRAV